MTNSASTSLASSLPSSITSITVQQSATATTVAAAHSLLCPPPPPSPHGAAHRSLKRKIRSFTFDQHSPPLQPTEAKTPDPDTLQGMHSAHSASPVTSSPSPFSSASPALTASPVLSRPLASPSSRPTPLKQPRLAGWMSTPVKSRTLLAEFQQLPHMQPPPRRLSDGSSLNSSGHGLTHKDIEMSTNAAFTLPPPPSMVSPVPRHLILHRHLQQHLQAQGGPSSPTPSPPLFPLSTASTAPTSPLSPSPCSSPILPESFPMLPPLDTDFASSHPGSRLPLLSNPSSPDSPPLFSMASHLLGSPARASLPLSSLSPDPKAFAEQRELHKKTPRNLQKHPPPTPMRLKRPAMLQRSSSLFETKMLESDLTPRAVRMMPGDAAADEQAIVSGAAAVARLCCQLNQSPHSVLHTTPSAASAAAAQTITFDGSFLQPVLVGEGSFFQVFRAIEMSSGECVAVKRSLRTFRGRKDRQGYMREVQLIKRLGPHPHIVKAHCAWQEELHLYIQMEYLPHTLEQWAEREQRTGRLTPQALLSWALQLSLALRHLHASGLLHLDVKPENVLVSECGVLKLGDFGSARGLDEVSDGSEGDSRYAALELLHVEKDAGDGSGRKGSGGARPDSIFLHPPRVFNEGGELVEQSTLHGAAFLHCPSTPSIAPPTNTNTPNSLYSASLRTATRPHSPSSCTPTSSATTPASASPAGAVSYGTDVFSLGLLLLELASSTDLPSSGPVWLDLRQGRAAGHVVGKVGGAAVEGVVLWCLRERVEERPSADELIGALRGMVDVDKLRAIGVMVD